MFSMSHAEENIRENSASYRDNFNRYIKIINYTFFNILKNKR